MSKRRKGLLQRILMVVLIVCMVCGSGIMALADEAVASTMRLTKTEGTVSVTNKNGRDMGTMADMKLFNGYHLATAQKSYAWMNLDDSKLIKLDAVSEAEIQKKGKDLEVLLNSGNLLFNVTENLKADETLNIRTSTMVTGIRGTCGWVKVLDASRTQVYILEGQVECYVMDPVSGQYKSVILRGGETAEFIVYDQTRVGDKCDILINRFSEKDIPGFVAVELMDNSDLRDRITGSMNIDMNWIFGNGPTILAQDQSNIEQKFGPINEAVKQQEHTIKKDPLFGNDDDDDDNGGGGGGGNGTVTPPDPDDTIKNPVSLYMDTDDTAFLATAENLEKYLALENIFTVNVYKADDSQKNMFYVDRSMIVETGKTVNFESGIDVTVNAGQTLTINGTVNVAGGNVVNNGSISNFSSNTLDVTGTIQNTSTGTIDNIGRIVVTGALENSGSVFNSGEIDGSVKAIAGYFENQSSGTITGDLTASKTSDTEVGEVVLNNTVSVGNLYFEGGTVEIIGITSGLSNLDEIGNGHLIVSDGSTLTNVSVASTLAGLGKVTVNAGGTITDVTSDGGEINLNGGAISTIGDVSPAKGTVNINSGTLGTVTLAEGTQNNPAVTLNMTGGTISQMNGAKYAVLNISGGNVTNSSLELTTFNNAEMNPTVTVKEMTGNLEIENGAIKSMSISDAGTLEVNGGTIESLRVTGSASEITDGNGIVLPVLNIPVVKLTNSTVGKLEMQMAEVTISGSTVTEQFIVEDSGNNILTFAEGTTFGVLTINDKNGVTITEDVTVEGDVTLNGQGQLIVSGATIKGSVLVNDNASLVMNSGEVMNGVQMNGTDASSVRVNGGTIHAGEDEVAIEFNAGSLSIDTEAQIMAYSSDELISFGSATLSAVYAEDLNNATQNDKITASSYPVCTKDSTSGELILSRYTADLEEALENPVDGDYLMLIDDVEWLGSGVADGIVVRVFNVTTDPVSITLDLNGKNLYADSGCKIYVNVFGTDTVTTENKHLTICDTGETKGTFTSDYVINSRANLTLENLDVSSSAECFIYSEGGDVTISGGDYSCANMTFISGTSGDITVTDGANIELSRYADGDDFIYTGIQTAGADVYLGCNSEGVVSTDQVTIYADILNEERFLWHGGSPEISTSTYDYTVDLGNVKIDSKNGSAVGFDGDEVQVIIGEDTILTSDSARATIYCTNATQGGEAAPTNEFLVFNGGEVINTNAAGHGAVCVEYDYYNSYEDEEGNTVEVYHLESFDSKYMPLFIPSYSESGEVGTSLKSANKTIVSYFAEYTDYTDLDNPVYYSDYYDVTETDWDSWGYKIADDEGGMYYVMITTSASSASALSLRAPSFSQQGDSSTENETVATDSNATATDSDATASDSNASGTPTTSKSAIPMAVAMLAGLMAIAPKLFEDNMNKNRKER